MEDLMDRKIDNMKVSYDRMVGILKEQLQAALASADEQSGEVEELSVDLDTSASASASAEHSREEDEITVASESVRAPLAPASLSAAPQQSTSDELAASRGARKIQLRKTPSKMYETGILY